MVTLDSLTAEDAKARFNIDLNSARINGISFKTCNGSTLTVPLSKVVVNNNQLIVDIHVTNLFGIEYSVFCGFVDQNLCIYSGVLSTDDASALDLAIQVTEKIVKLVE